MEFRTFVSPLALWKIGDKSILRQRTAELLGKPSSERQVDAPGERPLLADDRLMRSAYFDPQRSDNFLQTGQSAESSFCKLKCH
ncbi:MULTISPECIES: hypothetical protein [Paraburkholderia]|uniref:hypothetical protein n=1 Tax=Paraburkholderia TaxID=1822464 RepID=UPI0038B7A7ED